MQLIHQPGTGGGRLQPVGGHRLLELRTDGGGALLVVVARRRLVGGDAGLRAVEEVVDGLGG